jgi:hypothetical protein
MDFHFDPDQYNNGDGKKKKLTKKQAKYLMIGIVVILLALMVFA